MNKNTYKEIFKNSLMVLLAVIGMYVVGKAVQVPEVYFSYETKEPVKMVDWSGKVTIVSSIDELPDRYERIWQQ